MLPIKRGYIYHYHDVTRRYLSNTQFDCSLLRAMYNARWKWEGHQVAPLASVVGERAIRHWIVQSNEEVFYHFQYSPTSGASVMHRALTLEDLLPMIPEKDAKGATVRLYLTRQLKGQVAYGMFPFKKKATPVVAPPAPALRPLRGAMARAIERTRANPIPIPTLTPEVEERLMNALLTETNNDDIED